MPGFEELKNENARLAYSGLHKTINTLARLAFGFHVYGTENIPLKGPGLIASHHLHKSDVVLVPAGVPRHVVVVGRRGQMGGPLGYVFRAFDAVTIDRPSDQESDENENVIFDREQLKDMMKPLNDGRLELLFSSGTRTPNEAPENVLHGTAFLARRTGSPIIPAVIKGSEHLLKRKVSVKFGEPINPPKKPRDDKRVTAEVLAIQQEMYRSLP